MFYFDESCSSTLFDSPSRNIFVHLSTCKRVCEPDSRKIFDDYYEENFEAKRLGAIWASFSSGKEPEKGKSKLPASPKSVVDRGPTYEVVHVTPRKPAQIFGKTSKHGDVTRIQSMVYTTISPESRRIEDWLQYGVIMPDSGALSSLHAGSPADARVDVRLTAGISSDCLDSFDPKLTHQCSIGKPNWRIRFYYDSKSLKCKMFWYDGCPSDSRNIFEDIATCKWKCQGMIPPYEIEPTKESCLDNFDSGALKDCNYGRFEVRYFFNHYSKRCELFYYGGCHTESKNIFVDYDKCVQMCQMSTRDISS
uniref:BPTI/Kunitz inhibitor domain-containing protein n=1 Tax=Acrobeloides nanus TaxID=290746 RepID=A0A914D0A0_9BILA